MMGSGDHGEVWLCGQIAAKRQVELADQGLTREHFGHDHHGLHIRNPFGQGAVAMRAVAGVVKPGGNDCVPKGVKAQWGQPFFNIFICLEILHVFNIAKIGVNAQIWREIQ